MPFFPKETVFINMLWFCIFLKQKKNKQKIKCQIIEVFGLLCTNSSEVDSCVKSKKNKKFVSGWEKGFYLEKM